MRAAFADSLNGHGNPECTSFSQITFECGNAEYDIAVAVSLLVGNLKQATVYILFSSVIPAAVKYSLARREVQFYPQLNSLPQCRRKRWLTPTMPWMRCNSLLMCTFASTTSCTTTVSSRNQQMKPMKMAENAYTRTGKLSRSGACVLSDTLAYIQATQDPGSSVVQDRMFSTYVSYIRSTMFVQRSDLGTHVHT